MYCEIKNESIGVHKIVRVADQLFIPINEANADYQRYLEWLAEGNTPEPWNPEP